MTYPQCIVCDHCLRLVEGPYYDYEFEGKIYYYCTVACAVSGVQRHNVDECDRICKRTKHVNRSEPQGTICIH